MITGTKDRQHAYVALTRGTDANIAYVFTISPKRADPVPGPRPAPELARYDKIHAERPGDSAPVTPPAPAALAEAATRAQRHLAVAADAELRRRHPEQRFTPLRSAEPQAATDAQRAELSLTAGQDIPQAGQWIKDLAAGRRTFAGKLAERQSLMVPSEDPDYGDLGRAFPSWTGPGQGCDLAASEAGDPSRGPRPRVRPGARRRCSRHGVAAPGREGRDRRPDLGSPGRPRRHHGQVFRAMVAAYQAAEPGPAEELCEKVRAVWSLAWSANYAALAAWFHVIAAGNRGAGTAPAKPPGPYSTGQMAASMAGLMDRLELPRAHLLGIAMGRRIALALALAWPGRVDRLVLVAASPRAAGARLVRAGMLAAGLPVLRG